jgi:ankyrin repeat protein
MKRTAFTVLLLMALVPRVATGAPNPRDFFANGRDSEFASAVSKGDRGKLERLVGNVDVNQRGSCGVTFLAWALVHQEKESFSFLLEHGASPNIQFTDDGKVREGDSGSLIKEIFGKGYSVTCLSAQMVDPWYLDQVLKHGGNPNLFNPYSSFSPNPLAASLTLADVRNENSWRTENVKLLIAAGADVNFRDTFGTPVISQAALFLRYDLVYLMLQAGADPTVKNKYGLSIVQDIQRSSHNMLRTGPLWPWREKVVALLKARGIDIDRVEVNRGHHPSGPLPTSDEVSKIFEELYSDTHVTHVEILPPDPRLTKEVTFRVHFRAPPDPVEWWVDWRYWDKGDGTYR